MKPYFDVVKEKDVVYERLRSSLILRGIVFAKGEIGINVTWRVAGGSSYEWRTNTIKTTWNSLVRDGTIYSYNGIQLIKRRHNL